MKNPQIPSDRVAASVSSKAVPPKAAYALMPTGAWPVMLTPFAPEGQIDWYAYDQLVDWYLASGVCGLFCVCLSSELYQLEEAERLELARYTVARAAGRLPVIAVAQHSGESGALADAVHRLKETGVDTVVCLTNNFGSQGADAEQWRSHVEALLERVDPAVQLGIYECPKPYPRLMDSEELGWLASTGRFVLSKDTCCDSAMLCAKIAAIQGTPLRLYNADACTLLDSLNAGAHGYGGIAANYFPHLFAWLCANAHLQPELAGELSAFFRDTNALVHNRYIQSAKVYLGRAGLAIGPRMRLAEYDFSKADTDAMDALRHRVESWESRLKLPNPFEAVRVIQP